MWGPSSKGINWSSCEGLNNISKLMFSHNGGYVLAIQTAHEVDSFSLDLVQFRSNRSNIQQWIGQTQLSHVPYLCPTQWTILLWLTWNLAHTPMHGGRIDLTVWINVLSSQLYGDLHFIDKLIGGIFWNMFNPTVIVAVNHRLYIGKLRWAYLLKSLAHHKVGHA